MQATQHVDLAEAQATVLVVDDDPAAQGRIAELLVRAGYGLMQTTSGRDAPRLARQYRPDLVVVNAELRDSTAAEVVDALRADATTRDIEVLVVSPPRAPRRNGRLAGAARQRS